MRDAVRAWDSEDRDAEFQKRLGVPAEEAAGLLFRYWFGPQYVGTPTFTIQFGDGPPIPSRTGNFELPVESKAWLFDNFVAMLWVRMLKLRIPRSRPSNRPLSPKEEREVIAFSLLRDLLVRSYRKQYRGGRGRTDKLLKIPRSVWTKPPAQILPLLVKTALIRADKERRMVQRGEPLLRNDGNEKSKILYKAAGGGHWEHAAAPWEWADSFCGIPRRVRSLAQEAGPAAFREAWHEVMAGASPEQQAYARSWGRGPDLDPSPARLKVIRQSIVRKLERRLRRQA